MADERGIGSRSITRRQRLVGIGAKLGGEMVSPKGMGKWIWETRNNHAGMNHLPNLTNTPPGGWRYVVPETSKTIGPFTGWVQLKMNLEAYYATIGYPVPADLFAKVEEQICAANIEYCGESYSGMVVGKAVAGAKHTFHAAVQCLGTLISHRAGSGEKPALELQEARAQVCVACPNNTDITPCSVCNISVLKNLIQKLVGAKKTSVDAELKYCSVCHCANSAKVATKREAIWKHMPDWQKKGLPPTCWIMVEEKAQEAKYEQAV